MGNMRLFTFGIIAYFAIRTLLGFRDPPWLKWEYLYPPIDVLLVTMMLYIGDRDPLGNITIMYFLPIAEAAGTLNVVFAGCIGAACIAGSMIGSVDSSALHLISSREKPYNVTFRFTFLLLMASLFTFLARRAAEYRAELEVAADRNQLALDMHDGVQAQLITAAAQMELVQHLAAKEPAKAAEVAQESRGTLRKAADELRFLVQRAAHPGARRRIHARFAAVRAQLLHALRAGVSL